MSSATSTPASAASGTSSSEKPTGVVAMAKQTFKNFGEDNAMRLAAAMACYIMLALAPMIIVTLKVISVVPFLKAKTNQIVETQVTQLVGAQSGAAIHEMVTKAQQPGQGTVAAIVSLLLVLFSASGVFVSLQDALNTIWEVKPRPNAGWGQWLRKRFLSVGMVFGIGLLLLSSMVVTSILHVIIDAVFGGNRTGFVKFVAYAIDFVVTIGVAWVLFMGVFKFLPDAKITWSDVWVGALVTAVLFKLGQIGMAIYFAKGSTTSAYGAFGSIVAVLLWAYYSSAILFFGAEFTQVWAAAHGRAIEPEEHAEKITQEDRAQQGIPGEKPTSTKPPKVRVPMSPAVAGAAGAAGAPYRFTPTQPWKNLDEQSPYAFGAAGAALGALAAGIATYYLATDSKRPTRKQVAAVKLNERIAAIESKLGRVSRIRKLLEEMDVHDRIQKVEHEIHRAGRHVRAKDTGRPLWMVRLADRIGGRWSNV
jgi:membrane protein